MTARLFTPLTETLPFFFGLDLGRILLCCTVFSRFFSPSPSLTQPGAFIYLFASCDCIYLTFFLIS